MATQDESVYNSIPNKSRPRIANGMCTEGEKCAQPTPTLIVEDKKRSQVHLEDGEGDTDNVFGQASCYKEKGCHFAKNTTGQLEMRINCCSDKKVGLEAKKNGYLEQDVKTDLSFGNFMESSEQYIDSALPRDNIEPKLKDLIGRESTGTKRSSHKTKDENQSREISNCYANHYKQIFPKTSPYSLLAKKIDNYIEFFDDVKSIYESCVENVSGTVSKSVGKSRKNNQDHWNVAICTVDGQQQCYGTEKVSFSLQEIAYPINYCLATEQYGTTAVHKHIGFTPSCKCSGAEKLSIPLNPFTEAGSLLINAMLSRDIPAADRFDDLMNLWEHLVGGVSLGYSNYTYLSNKPLAHSLHAAGYLMKKAEIFPDNVDVSDAVDSLIQNQSMMVTSEQLAVAAATLANRGKCPLTGKNIFSDDTVQKCLSLMINCGFGHFSGEFAFRFGLPAKSSCSGSIMILIPNVMGICLYSPRLNDKGHSARGVEFIEKLCDGYLFHTFHTLSKEKKKIRRHSVV